jgi:hypothetical protein
MNLINATGMAAGYTLGLDKDARESLVVVVKGTFLIPKSPSAEPVLAPEQVPLVTADTFTGEPGLSAPVNESDYAPRKLRCDVLLHGSAYAPAGRAVERVTVSLRVGGMHKSFDVVGNRVWQAGAFSLRVSKPVPFVKMPFSYDNAFGGTDRSKGEPDTFRSYLPNHGGIGWHEYLDTKFLDNTALPNTEETGRPVTNPKGNYRPMALGPIARQLPERARWAGTYDQKWLDDVSPFLPNDFDERYFQSAPSEQQVDYLNGGEEVELVNLTPSGRTAFKVPKLDMPVEFSLRGQVRKENRAVIDTLMIEPDLGRFSLVWRTSLPLRRNIFEVLGIIAGRMSIGWYRARATGKGYYKSIQEVVASKTEAT